MNKHSARMLAYTRTSTYKRARRQANIKFVVDLFIPVCLFTFTLVLLAIGN
jgi:hypothetical protein